VNERVGFLPPPAPPIAVRIWENGVPSIRCPFCGTVFRVSEGIVKCPTCNTTFMVSEWNWQSFLFGVAVGLLIGLVISAGAYYFIFRPYVPVGRLITTLAEFGKLVEER